MEAGWPGFPISQQGQAPEDRTGGDGGEAMYNLVPVVGSPLQGFSSHVCPKKDSAGGLSATGCWDHLHGVHQGARVLHGHIVVSICHGEMLGVCLSWGDIEVRLSSQDTGVLLLAGVPE